MRSKTKKGRDRAVASGEQRGAGMLLLLSEERVCIPRGSVYQSGVYLGGKAVRGLDWSPQRIRGG